MLTVDDIKKHLNIDHDEDDSYIAELIAVAMDAVESISRPQPILILKKERGEVFVGSQSLKCFRLWQSIF